MKRLELVGMKVGQVEVIKFSHIHKTKVQTVWLCKNYAIKYWMTMKYQGVDNG
jgi:hypothetical protein